MKTFEFTEEMCAMIADALQDKITMWKNHNEVLQMHGNDEKVDNLVMKNLEKIGKLQTLLNYINS